MKPKWTSLAHVWLHGFLIWQSKRCPLFTCVKRMWVSGCVSKLHIHWCCVGFKHLLFCTLAEMIQFDFTTFLEKQFVWVQSNCLAETHPEFFKKKSYHASSKISILNHVLWEILLRDLIVKDLLGPRIEKL